jgi:hypothetical protein
MRLRHLAMRRRNLQGQGELHGGELWELLTPEWAWLRRFRPTLMSRVVGSVGEVGCSWMGDRDRRV